MTNIIRILLPCILAITCFATEQPAPRIVVIGARVSPSAIAYTEDLSLMKAILQSGGYATFANKAVFLIRSAKVEKVDVKSIIADPTKDIALRPWDTIVIE